MQIKGALCVPVPYEEINIDIAQRPCCFFIVLGFYAMFKLSELRPYVFNGAPTLARRSAGLVIISREALKRALAMGADAAVLLNDPVWLNADSAGVGRALAAAIRKIGSYDLILCGRQASDTDLPGRG